MELDSLVSLLPLMNDESSEERHKKAHRQPTSFVYPRAQITRTNLVCLKQYQLLAELTQLSRQSHRTLKRVSTAKIRQEQLTVIAAPLLHVPLFAESLPQRTISKRQI